MDEDQVGGVNSKYYHFPVNQFWKQIRKNILEQKETLMIYFWWKFPFEMSTPPKRKYLQTILKSFLANPIKGAQ